MNTVKTSVRGIQVGTLTLKSMAASGPGRHFSQNPTCLFSSPQANLNIKEQAILPFMITKHKQDSPCRNIRVLWLCNFSARIGTLPLTWHFGIRQV